ncbi:hypothetical protein R6Q59_030953 [Mikania micrantha]|uniref:Uncharacterized protein n=1 Tax=Mikania micrantha TaxID=192012 RepID=A0A5N6NY21_9ASTR|nr:hypothetical protein E3N88_16162 [Mikania micrantha]
MLTDKDKRENIKLPGWHWKAYPETKTLTLSSRSRDTMSVEQMTPLCVAAAEIAHNLFDKMTCNNNDYIRFQLRNGKGYQFQVANGDERGVRDGIEVGLGEGVAIDLKIVETGLEIERYRDAIDGDSRLDLAIWISISGPTTSSKSIAIGLLAEVITHQFNNADKTWINVYLIEAKQALGYPLEPSENCGDANPTKCLVGGEEGGFDQRI